MTVSFDRDIFPMFQQRDINHMRPWGVFLDDYAYMSDPAGGLIGHCQAYADHAHARAVLGYLRGDCKPQMPLGGPYWTAAQLALYEQWMTDGFAP